MLYCVKRSNIFFRKEILKGITMRSVFFITLLIAALSGCSNEEKIIVKTDKPTIISNDQLTSTNSGLKYFDVREAVNKFPDKEWQKNVRKALGLS